MKNLIEKIKLYLGSSKKNISYEREGISSARDWNMMVISTFIVLVISASASVYLYFLIDAGKLFELPADAQKANVTINQNLLDKTILEINSKASAFESAQKTKTAIPDPSI